MLERLLSWLRGAGGSSTDAAGGDVDRHEGGGPVKEDVSGEVPEVSEVSEVPQVPERAGLEEDTEEPEEDPVSVDTDEFREVEPPWIRVISPPVSEVEQVRQKAILALNHGAERVGDGQVADILKTLAQYIDAENSSIEPLPGTVRKLNAKLSEASPGFDELARIVEEDAALVERVFKATSGATFMKPPEDLREALMRLGTDELWHLSMKVLVYSKVFRTSGMDEEIEGLQHHGMAVARVSKWLASEEGRVDGQRAFLAGLMHDVGKLVVVRAVASAMRPGDDLGDLVERLHLQYHPAVGLLMLAQWGLAEEVCMAAGFHHRPDAAPRSSREMALVVHLADVAAHTARLERRGEICGGLDVLGEALGANEMHTAADSLLGHARFVVDQIYKE